MDRLNVLFIASECGPFVKTGGLGDVLGVLPKYISKYGHNVKVVIPRYYVIDINHYKLEKISTPLGVPMGIIGELWCGLYKTILPGSNVEIYFIDYRTIITAEKTLTTMKMAQGISIMTIDLFSIKSSTSAIKVAKVLSRILSTSMTGTQELSPICLNLLQT